MAIPGSNIRILRQQVGLSQRSLADAVGIDVSNLSRLESGKSDSSRETVEKIAEVLGVTISTLYAEVSKVESAALRMRNVPLLTPSQLENWKGPDSVDAAEISRHLYLDLRRATRFAFALTMPDESCAPLFLPDDELIFDPSRQPKMGSIVVAIDARQRVIIGRLRMGESKGSAERSFGVVPLDRLFPVGNPATYPGLQLRGTLIESRRQH
jgi:transcriptional regulator with XRE-family HTH domain